MRRSTSTPIVQAKAEIVSVGIDISKEHFNVALYRLGGAEGEGYLNRDFENTASGIKAFLRLLKKYDAQDAPLCMEATGRYWELLAFALNEAGHSVAVVNPARLKAYVKVNGWLAKTDKADAQYIAHFCARQEPEAWIPPTPERHELQSLTRHLEDLKRDRTRYSNRKKALPPSAAVRNSLDELIHQLDEQIAHTEQAILELSETTSEFADSVELLCSIPGIAHTTAVRLLAEMPNIANFPSVRQFTAYAGVNPSIHQSGKTSQRGSLSKCGNRRIRAALYFSAISAISCNPLVTPLAERLREKGRAKKQCIAAAMRKLLHIVYGILKSGKPFNPNIHSVANLT